MSRWDRSGRTWATTTTYSSATRRLGKAPPARGRFSQAVPGTCMQADAATVFDRLFTGQAAQAVEVGCLAHGRRKLIALQEMDCRVAYP